MASKEELLSILRRLPPDVQALADIEYPFVEIPQVSWDIATNIRALAVQAQNEARILQLYAGKRPNKLTLYAGQNAACALFSALLHTQKADPNKEQEGVNPQDLAQLLDIQGFREVGALRSTFSGVTTEDEGENESVTGQIIEFLLLLIPAGTGAWFLFRYLLLFAMNALNGDIVQVDRDSGAIQRRVHLGRRDYLLRIGELILAELLEALLTYLFRDDNGGGGVDVTGLESSLDRIAANMQNFADISMVNLIDTIKKQTSEATEEGGETPSLSAISATLKSAFLGKEKKPFLQEIAENTLDMLLTEGIVTIDGVRIWLRSKIVDYPSGGNRE